MNRPPTEPSDLTALGQRHLWGHFTNLSTVQRQGLPIIDRGEGAYVYDTDGRRYLDGLSGLFTVNIGHGRTELAQAAAQQSAKLRLPQAAVACIINLARQGKTSRRLSLLLM